MASADAVIESLQDINSASFANEIERIRARDAIFEALRKVQSPWDIAWEHNWVNGATNAAIKTLIDAEIFMKWAKAGWEPTTCDKLAELTGADAQLIRRMMRHVAGQQLVIEIAEDTYAPTPWAKNHISDPAFSSMYGGFYHELNNPMFRILPYFLAKTGYKNPGDVENGNLQYWLGEDARLFPYIATNTLLRNDFNDAMECHSKYNLTPWHEVYPTGDIVADAKAGCPLVVDIGGGKGHDLDKFRLRHPDVTPGSLILQDLPDILQGVTPHAAITVQLYDFFTPQPIKGARAYFMHNVLHDWTDEKAAEILRIVAAAMEKGYSSLLIHESLVSSVKPLARVTTSDLTMMACMSAKERTEADWRALISGAGLKVVKIWRAVQSVESIIEARVE
ncbi:O-methyltransferase [Xylariales sp. PMI_506]|nr:O-methyltransferase [Xylariales sp. PMI_506]